MIESQLIVGASASETSNRAVLNAVGLDNHEGKVGYMVFETRFQDKQLYCCWSGGAIVDGRLSLTPIGIGALEALSNLDVEGPENIEVFPLNADSEIPVSGQVVYALEQVEPGTKVCFVGDVQGALLDVLPQAFNVTNFDEA